MDTKPKPPYGFIWKSVEAGDFEGEPRDGHYAHPLVQFSAERQELRASETVDRGSVLWEESLLSVYTEPWLARNDKCSELWEFMCQKASTTQSNFRSHNQKYFSILYSALNQPFNSESVLISESPIDRLNDYFFMATRQSLQSLSKETMLHCSALSEMCLRCFPQHNLQNLLVVSLCKTAETRSLLLSKEGDVSIFGVTPLLGFLKLTRMNALANTVLLPCMQRGENGKIRYSIRGVSTKEIRKGEIITCSQRVVSVDIDQVSLLSEANLTSSIDSAFDLNCGNTEKIDHLARQAHHLSRSSKALRIHVEAIHSDVQRANRKVHDRASRILSALKGATND